MMIGHMLREPHRRSAPSVLHAPHAALSAPGGQQPPPLALGAPPLREGAYYYGASALHAGTVLSVRSPLPTSAPAPEPDASNTKTRRVPTMRTTILNATYDRYAIVDELVLPAAPDWPLRLLITAFTLAPASKSATAADAGGSAAPAPGHQPPPSSQPPDSLKPAAQPPTVTGGGPSGQGRPPPPLFLGLQASGPPRLRATVMAQRAGHLLHFSASLLLLGLCAAALGGLRERRRAQALAEDGGGDEGGLSESEMELGALRPASERGGGGGGGEGLPAGLLPVGRPVGCGSSSVPHAAAARVVVARNAPVTGAGGAGVHQGISADGEILTVGSRVQTQWTRARGGDDSWWAGAILTLHGDVGPLAGQATVIYDDGEEWTGKLAEIYALRGGESDDNDDEGGGGEAGHGGGGQQMEMPSGGVPMPTQPADRTR